MNNWQSNYARLSMELQTLADVREHLPEDVLQEYDHALEELQTEVDRAHGYSTDWATLADTAGLLHDISRALLRVR